MGNEVEIGTVRMNLPLNRAELKRVASLLQVSPRQTKLSRYKAHNVPTSVRPTFDTQRA
jgi:hypothetical protein